MRTSTPCPCQSGKAFGQCCGRFLNRIQTPKTPVQLMRSRYSAYALGEHGAYLLETWLPEAAVGLDAAGLSVRSTDWCGLEIVGKSQQGDRGFVEFKAFYLDADGVRQVHHERSVFVRLKGHWLYAEGEVT